MVILAVMVDLSITQEVVLERAIMEPIHPILLMVVLGNLVLSQVFLITGEEEAVELPIVLVPEVMGVMVEVAVELLALPQAVPGLMLDLLEVEVLITLKQTLRVEMVE
jgi:hypothetical protein